MLSLDNLDELKDMVEACLCYVKDHDMDIGLEELVNEVLYEIDSQVGKAEQMESEDMDDE